MLRRVLATLHLPIHVWSLQVCHTASRLSQDYLVGLSNQCEIWRVGLCNFA